MGFEEPGNQELVLVDAGAVCKYDVFIELLKNMFRLRQSFKVVRGRLFLNQVNSPLCSLA